MLTVVSESLGKSEVLIEVARTLRDHVRQVDTVARYGGEEFTVVLPRIDRDMAGEVTEKLRAAIEEHRIPGTVRLYGTPAEETTCFVRSLSIANALARMSQPT